MAYKNWDNVRDHRIYAYMNQAEMDKFLQAMKLQDMEQQATAARQMIIERSQQIIIESRKQSNRSKPVKTTVNYQFPSGEFTVFNPTKR